MHLFISLYNLNINLALVVIQICWVIINLQVLKMYFLIELWILLGIKNIYIYNIDYKLH